VGGSGARRGRKPGGDREERSGTSARGGISSRGQEDQGSVGSGSRSWRGDGKSKMEGNLEGIGKGSGREHIYIWLVQVR
jgi:hypothetical protein